MISESTKQFILENISKREFLSKEFLEKTTLKNIDLEFLGFDLSWIAQKEKGISKVTGVKLREEESALSS